MLRVILRTHQNSSLKRVKMRNVPAECGWAAWSYPADHQDFRTQGSPAQSSPAQPSPDSRVSTSSVQQDRRQFLCLWKHEWMAEILSASDTCSACAVQWAGCRPHPVSDNIVPGHNTSHTSLDTAHNDNYVSTISIACTYTSH